MNPTQLQKYLLLALRAHQEDQTSDPLNAATLWLDLCRRFSIKEESFRPITKL